MEGLKFVEDIRHMWEGSLRRNLIIWLLYLCEGSRNMDLKSGYNICDEGFLSRDLMCEKALRIGISYLDIAV